MTAPQQSVPESLPSYLDPLIQLLKSLSPEHRRHVCTEALRGFFAECNPWLGWAEQIIKAGGFDVCANIPDAVRDLKADRDSLRAELAAEKAVTHSGLAGCEACDDHIVDLEAINEALDLDKNALAHDTTEAIKELRRRIDVERSHTRDFSVRLTQATARLAALEPLVRRLLVLWEEVELFDGEGNCNDADNNAFIACIRGLRRALSPARPATPTEEPHVAHGKTWVPASELTAAHARIREMERDLAGEKRHVADLKACIESGSTDHRHDKGRLDELGRMLVTEKAARESAEAQLAERTRERDAYRPLFEAAEDVASVVDEHGKRTPMVTVVLDGLKETNRLLDALTAGKEAG